MSVKKIITILTVLILGVIILVLTSTPKEVATIIACDVGQGDAILIVKGTTQVLVDGGPSSEKAMSCLGRYIPFWDRNLELIVFTNTDQDHIGGLSSIISRYKIGKIVTGDGIGNSKALVEFVDSVRMSNYTIEQVGQGDIIRVGDELNMLVFYVLWPSSPDKQLVESINQKQKLTENKVLGASIKRDLNERSVVLLLKENTKNVLLTGDIGEPTEQSLIKSGILKDIDILKVGHHGSKFSSTQDFLNVVKPELAVISVGKNSYGHPTKETLSRLNSLGTLIHRTDQEGDIVIELTP